MKKNCHNCKHGYPDSEHQDGYLVASYFVCDKREVDSIEFENNLDRPEYLEKAKRCCELKQPEELPVKLTCKQCGGDAGFGWLSDKDNYICFDCFCLNTIDNIDKKTR